MNSPACRAMRGDGTVGGADRGSVSARTCPGIESMRAVHKARSRLYPRLRRSLRFREPRSLAPRSATLRGGKRGPAQGQEAGGIRGYSRAECCDKPPARPSPLKEEVGRGEYIGAVLSEVCDELAAESMRTRERAYN